MAVLIRLAEPRDAAAIAEIYRPYVEDTPVSFEEEAPDAAEMERRMNLQGLYPWLVAELDGEIAGFASSSPFRSRSSYRWTVETGVYLDPRAQGRGIGKALTVKLLELLTKQGFTMAVAGITLPNDVSVALHEKLGFAPCANYHETGFKLGQWRSVGAWAKDLAPRQIPPAELQSFAQFPFTA